MRVLLNAALSLETLFVFLPIPGSALQAKFTGPYVIEKKLSETDYVIRTPDRR